jgi:glycolate oxidase iron-sulfur subunit
VVSGNPGCTLQIAQALAATGGPMPVAHIAEVLDASIMGKGPDTLLHAG